MPAAPTTIKAARAAKNETKRRLANRTGIVGVGVTRRGTGYVVKVNLGRPVNPALILQELNDLPVVFEVVGSIRKR
jgi:PII-like signaling protein